MDERVAQFKNPYKKRETMSTYTESIKSCLPLEFARKTRSFHEIDRWKATEWRSSLKYTGPVVFKLGLKENIYNHFLTIHVTVNILSRNEMCNSVM